ncbi:putative serine/cysteine trypsin-like peptidase [Diplonema papillatum]|nr:putative serine/cysteine trypsin-like peptidase [Diplonema papillatum]
MSAPKEEEEDGQTPQGRLNASGDFLAEPFMPKRPSSFVYGRNRTPFVSPGGNGEACVSPAAWMSPDCPMKSESPVASRLDFDEELPAARSESEQGSGSDTWEVHDAEGKVGTIFMSTKKNMGETRPDLRERHSEWDANERDWQTILSNPDLLEVLLREIRLPDTLAACVKRKEDASDDASTAFSASGYGDASYKVYSPLEASTKSLAETVLTPLRKQQQQQQQQQPPRKEATPGGIPLASLANLAHAVGNGTRASLPKLDSPAVPPAKEKKSGTSYIPSTSFFNVFDSLPSAPKQAAKAKAEDPVILEEMTLALRRDDSKQDGPSDLESARAARRAAVQANDIDDAGFDLDNLEPADVAEQKLLLTIARQYGTGMREHRSPHSIAGAKGLANPTGHNNCFLNVVLQALWHLVPFRERFLLEKTRHTCPNKTDDWSSSAGTCLYCAIYGLFSLYKSSDCRVLPPGMIREVLGWIFRTEGRFQFGDMEDVVECLEAVLFRLHLSVNDRLDSCEPPCFVHETFSLNILEKTECTNRLCDQSYEPLVYSTSVQYFPSKLFMGQCPRFNHKYCRDLETCLNYYLKGPDRQCETCKKPVVTRTFLLNPPVIFALAVAWDRNGADDRVSGTDLKLFASGIPETLILSNVYTIPGFHSPDVSHKNEGRVVGAELVAITCFYGRHYTCYCYREDTEEWIYFDDSSFRRVGLLDEVRANIVSSGQQPVILFYKRTARPSVKDRVPTPKPKKKYRWMFADRGTGFLVAPGLIMTSLAVLRSKQEAAKMQAIFFESGKQDPVVADLKPFQLFFISAFPEHLQYVVVACDTRGILHTRPVKLPMVEPEWHYVDEGDICLVVQHPLPRNASEEGIEDDDNDAAGDPVANTEEAKVFEEVTLQRGVISYFNINARYNSAGCPVFNSKGTLVGLQSQLVRPDGEVTSFSVHISEVVRHLFANCKLPLFNVTNKATDIWSTWYRDGDVGRAMRIIQNFPQNTDVVLAAVDELQKNICDEDKLADMMANNGPAVLLDVLFKYRTEERIVCAAVRSLWQLSFGDDERRKAIVNSNGIPIVLQCFEKFLAKAEIVEYSCVLLFNLSSIPEHVTPTLCEKGVPVVIKAMEAYPETEVILKFGLGILMNIARSTKNEAHAATMLQQGGALWLTKGMTDCVHNEYLVEHAVLLLAALVSHGSLAQHPALKPTVEPLVSALRRYSSNKAMAKEGNKALWYLGLDPANRVTIIRHGLEVLNDTIDAVAQTLGT